MGKSFIRSAAVSACLALGSGLAEAQNAQIIGSIKDQSGAVIPGATLSARNQGTGLVRLSVTNEAGDYRLVALPPGVYTITAELLGFTTETRSDVRLVIDQTAVISFTMRPAALEETITVTGESPIVDTTRSDVATNVSTMQIQELPVASRRWIDLALLVPGVSQDNIRAQYWRGNVNVGAGAREYSNAYLVDGVDNRWAEMGEARQNFAMDSIQEFKVVTSTFKAEYGLATGGLVSVVSKSGTNDLRGSGFIFYRDDSLTAREHFQKEKPAYSRYQYGGSVGGPIVRDRTHFFFAYERTDEDVYLTLSTRGVWPEYDGTYVSNQWRWNYTAKVDHQLSSRQSLFVRFAQELDLNPIPTTGGTTAPSASFDLGTPRHSLVAAHTWVMSDRKLNDLRFQLGFSKYQLAPGLTAGHWKAGDFGPDREKLMTPELRYPSLSIGSANSQMGPERRWQIKDDFSYLIPDWGGTHQLKMGVDYNYITFQADGTSGWRGTWIFPKDEVYNPNDRSTWPTQYRSSLPRYGDVPVHWFSAYAQDDWEPASGLVFNLGLRWDLQRGVFNEDLTDRLRRVEKALGPGFGYPLPIPFHDTDPISGSPFSERGDWNNFGSRVGFAWDPTRQGDTSLHAAYGMFYDNIRTLTTDFGEIQWPQAKSIVIRNPSYPDPFQGRSRDEFLSTAPPNITVLSNDFVNPYAHQFNVGLTQQLARNLAVTVDFTAVNRYSDRDQVDVNLPDQVTGQFTWPQFGRVTYSQSTADNTYKALLVKVEKRLSDNYQFLASYTLSQAKDSSVVNSLGDVYGYTRVDSYGSADRRHRLVVSGIVRLPHDMQISAIGDFRSSLSFNPRTSNDLNRDGYTGDLPPGVLPQSGCRSRSVDAVNAFRVDRGLPAVSEGDIDCPGFSNLDVRFSKFFRIKSSQRLEFIAQLFNVFNHANFGSPSSNPASAIFGQVTQLLPFTLNAPSRQVELAVRYHF